MSAESFEQLVTEGWSHPTEGWDFSWIGSRIQEDPLPWDYTATVIEMAFLTQRSLESAIRS